MREINPWVFAAVAVAAGWASGADWAQFRGTTSNPVVEAELPSEWAPDGQENVAWTADLPGRGPSSPIVVGDRVIVTSSSGVKQDRLHVLCYDADSGKQLWHRQFWATGRTLCHPSSANAAPTPASDGERIFAFYSSNDLICLDLDGNLQWYRGLAFDYPKAGNDVGMSSSPIVIGETVVVQVENQGDSFAAGIDAKTGENRWRIQRKARANWASPVAFATDSGSDVVLLQDTGSLTAVDAKTGNKLWDVEVDASSITSPTVSADALYVTDDGLSAFKLKGTSRPEKRWTASRLKSGPGSPVAADGKVYVVNRSGVLNCGSAENGETLWQLRLKGTCWATPVLASGKLFCPCDKGVMLVVDTSGDKGKVVSEVDFGGRLQGTPAIADDALFVRTDERLWKITAKK